MFLQRTLLLLFLLHVPVLQAQELLLLTFAQGKPGVGKVYGSEKVAPAPTLTVVEGQEVLLQKSSGTDYQLQSSPHGWAWTQVQQVARDATSIAVTPRRQGEKVNLEVKYFSRERGESIAYTSTVNGDIGQWIPLMQAAGTTQSNSSKAYVAGNMANQLSIRVDRAR